MERVAKWTAAAAEGTRRWSLSGTRRPKRRMPTKAPSSSCVCTSPDTPASRIAALANLRRICEEHLAGRYRVEVIDLMENPQRAQRDQILAIPTLVRRLPQPIRRIIGDLSDSERVLVGLEVKPTPSGPR